VRAYFREEKTSTGFVFFYGPPTCGGPGTSLAFEAQRP
jgi:hypothetical protein